MTRSNSTTNGYQTTSQRQREREREQERSRSRDNNRSKRNESIDGKVKSKTESQHSNSHSISYSTFTIGLGISTPHKSSSSSIPNPRPHRQTPGIGTKDIPGSPSQIDPFGSQITSPKQITITIPRSRPQSTVLSPGTSISTTTNTTNTTNGTGTGTGSIASTPKLILASPSTSTIHYLFPSSSGLLGPATATATATTGGQGESKDIQTQAQTQSSVQRTKSTSSTRGHRTSYPQNQSQKDSHAINFNFNDKDKDTDKSGSIPKLRNGKHTKSSSSTSVSLHYCHRPTPVVAVAAAVVPARTPALAPSKRQAGSQVAAGNGTGVKKSDIGPPTLIHQHTDTNTGTDEMVGLRRQPAMIDLSGRGKNVAALDSDKEKMAKKRESVILLEIENRRERRGWEIGSRPQYGSESIDPPSPKTKTGATHGTQIRGPLPYPYVPSASYSQQQRRRRSQSLTSPRPAPSPPVSTTNGPSPLLPAPDFGDPLTLSVVIDSPSYSHLDYSIAGSSTPGSGSGSSAAMSRNSTSQRWSKATATFPHSASMSRGDTRQGLGNYDAGKLKARQDAEKRLNDVGGEEKLGRLASIRRTVSLRRKDQDVKAKEDGRRSRPRSQSLTARSARNLGLGLTAPPLPLPSQTQDCHTFYGDLSIDLGERYPGSAGAVPTATTTVTSTGGTSNLGGFSPYKPTPSTNDWMSPLSSATSVFPHSTPSSGYDSLPSANININTNTNNNGIGAELGGKKMDEKQVIHLVGYPFHPTHNSSDVSILAPSTIGLGFSPIGTPVSLPESLQAEVIDLTESRPFPKKSNSPVVCVDKVPNLPSPSPSPSPLTTIPQQSATERKIPRRSLLLAQNTFYLPPVHQKPGIARKPSLRSSKSLGPGFMKRAYTSANLRSDATAVSTATPSNESSSQGLTPGSGPGLLKAASIRSNADRTNQQDEPRRTESQIASASRSGRLSATPSMRFNSRTSTSTGRRPITTFSLCSPPDAIDPLPCNSPEELGAGVRSESQARTLRSNKSSPFLSASASLRFVFGKEGFVARSLSQAFERDHKDKDKDFKERPTSSSHNSLLANGLKYKISTPLEATRSSFKTHNEDKDKDETRKNIIIKKDLDNKWRETLLQDVVSLSLKEGLSRLAEAEESQPQPSPSTTDGNGNVTGQRMVSSGSKARLAIPDQLLSAPIININIDNEAHGDRDSVPSGLEVRAVTHASGLGTGIGIGTRALGQMGGEDSGISGSVYSNAASTLFESKKTTSSKLTVLGKGLPSSLSSGSNITKLCVSPKAEIQNKNIEEDSNLLKNEPKLSQVKIGGRIISQPMPLIDDDVHQIQKQKQNLSLRSTRPIIDNSATTTTTSTDHKMKQGSMKISSSPSRSRLLNLRVFSGNKNKGSGNTDNLNQPANTSTIGNSTSRTSSTINRTPSLSFFSQSLRSTLRPNIPQSKNQSGSSLGVGISSSDLLDVSLPLPPARAILDQLVKRDEEAKLQMRIGIEQGQEQEEKERERDKVRKVLAWRNQVDENERLAKLEERMRGFVQVEKERIKDIGMGLQ